MAITRLQSVSTWPLTGATSTALALPGDETAASLLIAFIAWNDPAATCTVADTRLNSWQALGGPFTGADSQTGRRIQLFCAPNVSAGANTVTATFTASVTRRGVAIHEVAGCDTSSTPNDGAASYLNVINSNVFNSATIVTTVANTYLFGGMVTTESVGDATNGFTLIESANFGLNGTAQRIVSSAGSYFCGWTTNVGVDNDNQTVICAFKAAGTPLVSDTPFPPLGRGATW